MPQLPQDPHELSTLARAVKQTLEDLASAGLSHLPRAARSESKELDLHSALGAAPRTPPARTPVQALTMAAAQTAPGEKHGAPPTQAASSPPRAHESVRATQEALLFESLDNVPRVPPEERPALLEAFSREVAQCTRCPVLVPCRTQTVFGVGNPNAELCFVGEAPGRDEDLQGEPFVGRAGQLLNRILAACKMRREEVYICNILKCRPPDNRTPLPDEVANCRPFLDRQLEIVRPRFICALGGVAAQSLLGVNQSMGRLRGRFYQYRDSQVLCTYHPAYLLRNPAAKAEVWEDMKMLMSAMGRPVS